MPVVESDGFGDGLTAVFRMVVAALPLVFGKSAKEEHPAIMQGVEEAERVLGGSCKGVVQFGPELLIVGLDGGPILGERQADADVCVHVAVGDVVDELADGPATVAVRRIELGVAEAVDSGTQIFRERGKGSDVRAVIGEIRFGAMEFADGEAGVDGERGSWGCGCGAHTPQGTPRGTGRQGGYSRRVFRQENSADSATGLPVPRPFSRRDGSGCRCGGDDGDGDGDATQQKRRPRTTSGSRGGRTSSYFQGWHKRGFDGRRKVIKNQRSNKV